MSSRPWMPFYPQDFKMDTLDLTVDEIGVYFIMLLLAWRRDEAGLPNDMAALKRMLQSCIANFHGHSFNRIVPKILKRYWALDDDGIWRNKRLTKERQKADKLSAKQQQNANKRWAKTKENKDLGHANAMPSQLQSQPQEKYKNISLGRPSDWWTPGGTNGFETDKERAKRRSREALEKLGRFAEGRGSWGDGETPF